VVFVAAAMLRPIVGYAGGDLDCSTSG